MNCPSISVIMPVYNAERYVAEAVESILTQTFADFEFLIIDDGSTDSSLRILERYAAQDARIRLFSRENRGLVATLNEMLADARGSLVARMDADDISLPERFAEQVGIMRSNLSCVCLGTFTILMDSDGDPLREFCQFETHDEIDGAHMRGLGGAIVHPSMIARTEALREVKGYRSELRHAEDIDLFLRLAEVGRLQNVPKPLFRYRVHLQSVGHENRAVQGANCQEAVLQAHIRRNLPYSTTGARKTTAEHLKSSYKRWAWWALGAGNIQTARKHAWNALRQSPLDREAWKVAACALRGH